MTRVWIAAIAALLAVSSALCQAAEPLLFDFTTLKHKPSDVGTKDGSVPAGTAELVDGKFGKACKFAFVEATGTQFFTAWVNPQENWDDYEGFSFWVKGDGSKNWGGLEFIDGSDYSLRYGYCFPIDSTEWVKVTVAWSDLTPEVAGPPVDPKTGYAPSKFRNLWFGKWVYWREYPACSYIVENMILEKKIGRTSADHAPQEPGVPRVLAKLKEGKPITIVTMGDSLTDKRHWANREKDWAEVLARRIEAKYKSKVTLVNPAIGGTTLSQNTVLIPRWIRETPEPDLVTICFGYNDWDTGVRKARFKEYVNITVDRIRRLTKGNADILIMTTCPAYDRWDTFSELCQAEYEAAKDRGAGFADLATAFHKAGSAEEALRREYWSWDKTHLGSAGHDLVAETVLAAIESAGLADLHAAPNAWWMKRTAPAAAEAVPGPQVEALLSSFELGQHHRGAQESSGSRLHERPLAAVTAEPAPQQVVGLAHTSSEEPLARVYSPRILAPGIADTYSLRTFAQFDRWRELSGDAKAYEVYRYLADTHTGLYHMNVVAEGDDALSEFVEIRDPVKILNVYGYAYCGILGPTMAGICEGIGLGPARTVVLPGWNHVAAETYYDNQWHYLDLDVRAVFRRDDGRLASLEEAAQDPSLWRDRGPLFFPNDPLDSTRAIYEKTIVEPYYGFQQAGHTMDYVLRPGERLTRWWRPQGGRWHHLAEYNDQPWLRRLIEDPPRGPKPNHRDFTVHNHGNGRFIYEPQLTDTYVDFEHGVEEHSNVMVTSSGLRVQQAGSGVAVFEVRSPYIIVPRLGELDRREDDTQAATLEWSGRHVSWSISSDNGLTWLPVEVGEEPAGDDALATIDLTRWVSGRYGYSLRCTLNGNAGDACLRRLRITTWVQLAPASLPALRQGRNAMRLVTGDHYGLSTRVVEVRSRASRPEELHKYLVTPPEDYDPVRTTARIRGTIIVKVAPPPGTRIAWFTATGQFVTHQQASATQTRNVMAYAVGDAGKFETIYAADVPTFTHHWHYNAASEVVLDAPADMLHVRYTGDPALNNFAIYAHCLSTRPCLTLPLEVTHCWTEEGVPKQSHVTLSQPGEYEVMVNGEPVNDSVEMAVSSVPRPDGMGRIREPATGRQLR